MTKNGVLGGAVTNTKMANSDRWTSESRVDRQLQESETADEVASRINFLRDEHHPGRGY